MEEQKEERVETQEEEAAEGDVPPKEPAVALQREDSSLALAHGEVHVGWYTKLVCRHYCLWMGVVAVLVLGTIGIWAGVAEPAELGGSFTDPSAIRVKRLFAFIEAREEAWDLYEDDEKEKERSMEFDSLNIYFESRSNNMLSEENLETVRKFEEKIRNDDKFEDWCQLEYIGGGDTRCTPTTSINAFLYNQSGAGPVYREDCTCGSFWDSISCQVLDSSFFYAQDGYPVDQDTFQPPLQELCRANSTESECAGITKDYSEQFLSVDKDCSNAKKGNIATATYVRSSISFGGPLKGYDNVDDNYADQWDEMADYMRKELLYDLYKWKSDLQDDNDDVIIYFEGDTLELVWVYLDADLLFIAVSFAIVFVVMWQQTQSVFLSLCGMVEILCSFPLALVLWEILDGQYVTYLVYLSPFLSLGYGADDVFVMVDAWEQSVAQPPAISGSFETRFAWMFKRAAHAMFITTFTTLGAFAAASSSPIWDIRCFGVVVGFAVLANYLLVISWFAGCLVFYEKHVRNKCDFMRYGLYAYWMDPQRRNATKESRPSNGDSADNTAESSGNGSDSKQTGNASNDNDGAEPYGGQLELSKQATSGSAIGMAKQESSASQHRLMTQNGHTANGDTDANANSDMTANANGTEAVPPPPTTTTMSAFRKHIHTTTRHVVDDTEKLRAVERFFHDIYYPIIERYHRHIIAVFVVMIIVATSVFATTLRAATTAPREFAQDHYMTRLRNIVEDEFDASSSDKPVQENVVFGIRSNHPISYEGVHPADWSFLGTPRYHNFGDDEPFDLYAGREELQWVCTFMYDSIVDIDDRIPDGDGYYCALNDYAEWLSVAQGTSLQNVSRDDFNAFFPLWRNDTGPHGLRNLTAFDPNYEESTQMVPIFDRNGDVRRFRMYWMGYNTTSKWTDDSRLVDKRFDDWQGAMKEANQQIDVVKGYVTNVLHEWDVAREVLLSSAYRNFGISVCISIGILAFATHNYLLVPIGTVCLYSIVALVFFLMSIAGWKINVLESISVSLAAGLAVDFTVHIIHAHSESVGTREERCRAALTKMGVSVTSGAITTCGAGLALLFCQLLWFKRFGQFIAMVISMAYLVAITFLPAMLVAFGPAEGEAYVTLEHLHRYFKWVRSMGRTSEVAATQASTAPADTAVAPESGVELTEQQQQQQPPASTVVAAADASASASL